MPYYLLRADSDHHVSMGPADPGLWDFFLDAFPEPAPFKTWKPFELEAITEFVDDPNALGDIIDFNATGICLFSERACAELSSVLERYGELLPVFRDKQKFYLYHVTNVINALDEELSQVDRFSDGRIMRVKKHVFKHDVIGDDLIFGTPENKWQIFVSDQFVNAVRKTDLTGFIFESI